MTAFLTKNYHCTKCQKGYDHKEKHKCNKICHMCCKIHNDNSDENWIYCHTCNRYFKGQQCFNLHQQQTVKENSTCKLLIRCGECGSTINTKKNIKGNMFAERSSVMYAKTSIQKIISVTCCPSMRSTQTTISVEEELIHEQENPQSFIFFDFECTHDDMVQCETGSSPDESRRCQHCFSAKCGVVKHVPNLCIVHKLCSLCMDTIVTDTSECEHCGKNELIFKSPDSLDEFCRWLFSEDNYKATVICHNFQGYDSYPVLHYLYRNAVIPTIIPNGA